MYWIISFCYIFFVAGKTWIEIIKCNTLPSISVLIEWCFLSYLYVDTFTWEKRELANHILTSTPRNCITKKQMNLLLVFGQRLRNCITIFASSNCNNKKSDNRMAFKILPHHTKAWALVYAVHVCYLCGRRASTQQTTCCRRNWRRKLLRAFIYGRANVQAFRATHTHPYLHTLAKYCGNHFVWVREFVAQWTLKYVCAIAR